MRPVPACAAALLLASCGGGDDSDTPPAARPGAEAIECAIAGGAFERSCAIERRETAAGLAVTIRNAQGGFRRFVLPRDNSGVRAADGAEQPIVEILADGRVEIAIGGDRYRVPATMSPRPGR